VATVTAERCPAWRTETNRVNRSWMMENPRPHKVAVVEEVRQRLDSSPAAVLTEYRGLTVSDMAQLRHALRAAGADYKVYKNTLVRLAVVDGRHQALDQLLTGPTAIAFVNGEISAVAKALRDYARTNPHLVIKGGVHADAFLSAQELTVLADLPSREVLLGRVAGGIAAPLRQLAGLMEALSRNFAYGLKALVDQRGGAPVEAAASETGSTQDAPEVTTDGATEASASTEDTPGDTADDTADATAEDSTSKETNDNG
jgi:large subunit ribosomal protein L10